MKVILNETERKPLATLFGEYTDTKLQYLRASSYGYQIGDPPLTREGSIEGSDTVNQIGFDKLLVILNANGYCPKETDFHPAQKSEAEATSIEETELTITIPLENVNAKNLISPLGTKGLLIKHVLHIDDLRSEPGEDNISFPRFSELPEPNEVHTYSTLITALCEMSKNQKRVSITEKPVNNERYILRYLLLRLGSTGNEYKADRKIPMRYLPGNSIFKGGEGHAISKQGTGSPPAPPSFSRHPCRASPDGRRTGPSSGHTWHRHRCRRYRKHHGGLG